MVLNSRRWSCSSEVKCEWLRRIFACILKLWSCKMKEKCESNALNWVRSFKRDRPIVCWRKMKLVFLQQTSDMSSIWITFDRLFFKVCMVWQGWWCSKKLRQQDESHWTGSSCRETTLKSDSTLNFQLFKLYISHFCHALQIDLYLRCLTYLYIVSNIAVFDFRTLYEFVKCFVYKQCTFHLRVI